MVKCKICILVQKEFSFTFEPCMHASIWIFPLQVNLQLIYSLSSAAPPATGGLAPAISLTDNALKHLNKMRSERNEDLCLRIGVKQGGCSGMSYTMEFEKRENARPDDSFIEYNGFIIGMFILFYVLCFLKINCQKLLPTIFNFKF